MSTNATNARRCSWAGCNAQSRGSVARDAYCVMHAALYRMRIASKQRGSSVPSRAELEGLVPSDGRCPICRREMCWTKAIDASRVVTLQHDRNGGHRLICSRCNTRHARMPGDSFYELPQGHKHCRGCNTAKPVGAFGRDARRVCGVRARCLECERRGARDSYHKNKSVARETAPFVYERD